MNVDAVRGIAALVERKLGRRRTPHDWPLACKAAVLVGALGELWLWDSVEAVVRKHPPADNAWSYFHRCLDNKARELGVRLARELSRIVLPAELLADDGEIERDLSERLCVKVED